LTNESPIQAKYLKPGRSPEKPKLNVMVASVDDTLSVRPLQSKVRKEPQRVVEKKVKNIPASKKERQEIKMEEPIVLKTVVFSQQSARLPSDSFQELNELVAYMKRNPLKKVEIRGHTDYAGDSLDNHHLSEQRAKAVEAYLVKGGVEKERISVKALGGSQPVVKKNDIEDRLMNRRVEFVVTD
jgi:outer membrane protein OmpA-like peptidoglycan-associated protein